MTSRILLLMFLAFSPLGAFAQGQVGDGNFVLALPTQQGQLRWQAPGYKSVQNSAKPNGEEIGIRGRNDATQITFLGFLFRVDGQVSLTSDQCRDNTLAQEKRQNPSLATPSTSQLQTGSGVAVDLVSYSGQSRDGIVHIVRTFVAKNNICGDLEFYALHPLSLDDPSLKAIFQSYRFDPDYAPQFRDIFVYAQILFGEQQYAAAGPLFELSLSELGSEKNLQTMRRTATDQAGMAYGISGNVAKSREIFDQGITTDPDYPLYYYNLACADAQEMKLADAERHLRQAFARKANVISGEAMPDPSKDNSFLPYKDNKEFWTFVLNLK